MNTHKTKKSSHNKTLKSSNYTVTKEGVATLQRDSDKPQCRWLEEYRDCFDGRIHPVTQKFLDRISTELIQFANTEEENFRVNYFFLKKNIPIETVFVWKNKYRDFAGAYNSARALLAIRKEGKHLNSAIVMGTMGRDDDEYDAWLTKQAEQKMVIQKKLEDEDSDNHLIIEIKEIKR